MMRIVFWALWSRLALVVVKECKREKNEVGVWEGGGQCCVGLLPNVYYHPGHVKQNTV